MTAEGQFWDTIEAKEVRIGGLGNSIKLDITNEGTSAGLNLDQNGNGIALEIDAESTTVAVFQITNPQSTTGSVFSCGNANALTTGSILNLVSNSSSTGTRALVLIKNDNTLATGTKCLDITQDALDEAIQIDMGTLDKGFFNFVATADADATSAISTLNTTGTVTDHIQISINGASKWLSVSDDPS